MRYSFAPPTEPSSDGDKLGPCITRIFEQLFTGGSLDLSEIRLHTGIPRAVAALATITPAAVTTGRDIYFKDGWRSYYNNHHNGHLGALTTMAEELWHSYQAKQVNSVDGSSWAMTYGAASLGAKLRGGDPYHDNLFEVDAKDVARQMAKFMQQDYGNDPCATLGLSPF